MGQSGCPLRGLLLLALIGRPGCLAVVQISVPAQVEVLLGSLVTIPCTHSITGSPDTRLVEWFVTDRDGERRRVAYSEGGHGGVDQGTEYSGHVYMDPDLSLVLPKADVRDERAFSCQVTAGAAGSAEGVAQLRVYEPPEPPELTANPGILSVMERSVSEIATCSSRNANPAPTISWFKDGARLEAPTERNDDMYVVSRSVKEASGLQSVSSTLYLRPSKADKDAQFQCLVQYPLPQGKVGNTTSERFSLVLHYFTENVEFMLESPLVIKEGDDVRLRCRGDGQPEPEYIFYRVQASKVMELATKQDGVLILPSVSRANSGTYRCQVLDFDSPPEVQLEKEVTIHVNYLDPLTLHPGRRVTVPLGGDVTLTCSGQGSQPPKLVWRKGKERVAHGGTHTLHSVSYHVAGTYTCEASVPSVPGLQRDQTIQVTVEGTELSPGFPDGRRDQPQSRRLPKPDLWLAQSVALGPVRKAHWYLERNPETHATRGTVLEVDRDLEVGVATGVTVAVAVLGGEQSGYGFRVNGTPTVAAECDRCRGRAARDCKWRRKRSADGTWTRLADRIMNVVPPCCADRGWSYKEACQETVEQAAPAVPGFRQHHCLSRQ
nr:basal cell adhesion molecule-like [Chelonoidis abingdonii]